MTRTRSALSVGLAGLLALGATACAPNNQASDAPSASTPTASRSSVAAETSAGASESASATSATSSSDATPAETVTGGASGTSAAPTASDASSSSSSTAPTASADTTPVDVNAEITAVSQIPTKLSGTSKEFRAFVTKLAKDSGRTANGSTCPNFQISVYKYWPSNDQATGGMTACGGYEAIWFTDARGTWKEFGFQSVPFCSVLRAEGVPHAIDMSDGFGCMEKGSTEMVSYDPEA